MKKLVSVLLVLTMITATFAGCGEKDVKPETNPEPTGAEAESDVGLETEKPETEEEPETDLPEEDKETETKNSSPVGGNATTAVEDISEAGLPEGAVILDKSDWSTIGVFKIRPVGYKETEKDPTKFAEGFPETNKVYTIYWETEATEDTEDMVDGSKFDFSGPMVTSLNMVSDEKGETKATVFPKTAGAKAYAYSVVTAEDIDDIEQVWYTYSVKNEESGSYDKFYNYISSFPSKGLVVNEQPAEISDYYIPLSAQETIGEWSETSNGDHLIRMRTLAMDEISINDKNRPDTFHPDDRLFVLYFEVENMGEEDLQYKSASPKVKGSAGTNDMVSLWTSYDCTPYSGSFSDPFLKGDKTVVTKAFVATDLANVEEVSIFSMDKAGNTQVPFDFSDVK